MGRITGHQAPSWIFFRPGGCTLIMKNDQLCGSSGAPGTPRMEGIRGYLLAVLCLALAFGSRWMLDPLWGDRAPYVCFVLAELIVMRVVGGGPLAFTAVAGFLLADWFFVEPRHSLLITSPVDQVSAVVYLIISAVLLFISLRERRLLARERVAQEELRRNTEELRESEARYSALVAHCKDAILLTDPAGAILTANPEACRMFGRSEEELRLNGWTALLEPTEPSRVKAAALKRQQESEVQSEVTLVRKDGSKFIGEVSSGQFIDRAGLPRNSSSIRDITARKRAEAELARLAAIVESSDDAIIGKDLEGAITSWNAGAERLYGYTAAEAIGRSIDLLTPQEVSDDLPALLVRVGRGERVSHFETVRRARDGRLVPVSLSISPVRNADGTIVGASSIARDISERKQAEQERERLVQELQTALVNVKTLRGLLPICATCKKIRDDKGYWNQIEFYIREHSSADFTHGICPECAQRFYGDLIDPKNGGKDI